MTESKGKYLELPTVINGDQILETASFIDALYIQGALEELEKGRYERVEAKLEDARKRLRGLIEEIKDVKKRQKG